MKSSAAPAEQAEKSANPSKKTDWNQLAMLFILRERIGSMNCISFTKDVPTLFFHMMKLFIIMA